MTDEQLIEEAAKEISRVLLGRTSSGYGTFTEAAHAALAVFEEAHAPTAHGKESDTSLEHVKNGADSSHVTPTDDEREALADFLEDLHGPWVTEGGCDFRGWNRGYRSGDVSKVTGEVDALLSWMHEHGFRRPVSPEPSARAVRPGFFPNGQCRHYQLADGWAKIWCTRTEDGHTEHETAGGVRWTPDAVAEPQGEPSDVSVTAFLDKLGEEDGYIDEARPDWIIIDGHWTSEQIEASIRAAVTGQGESR